MGLSAVLVRISRLVRLQQSKALNGIHSAEQFRIILERERAWADRNQSQFSVVVFGVGNTEADSTQVRHLAHVLANRIRLTDYTGWFDGSRIGAILPETSANGAWRLADDVCQTVAAKASPPECTVYTYPSGSKGPSDRSGHSGPFHIQDIPSKRKTTASSYSSASTKHTGRRNIDFTAQQPKRVFQRLIVGPSPRGARAEKGSSEKPQGTKAEVRRRRIGSIVDAGRQSHGALQPGEARATFEAPSKVNRTPDGGELAEGLKPFLLHPLPVWKWAMDIVGATVALIVFSPIMVAVAIAIKLTSKGPVIFKQQRAGLGGRPFTFYKFRSMVVGAEVRKNDLLKYNERTGPAFKMTNDPRVTRVGDFIRKWSLDELPQLFNVLRGDLSLVGPRPLPIEEASQHNQWQDRRLYVTPGITCLWQAYARHDKSFDRWARLDIEYIMRRSPLLDLKILLKTPLAVLSRNGAC